MNVEKTCLVKIGQFLFTFGGFGDMPAQPAIAGLY
jgi:hypothetical protein